MKRLLSLALVALPGAALAHPGHDAGSLGAGFAHPLGGADHVLAMVALGLLAAQAGGRALWLLPTSFVAAMLAGGAAGWAGLPFGAVEPVILASVIILGATVAIAARLPLGVMAAMAAAFGHTHGWAHGAEGPAQGLPSYALGFALATALLHGAGILAGRAAAQPLLRAAGGLTAVAGLALVVGG
ncbi:HupE/UreJ family protein [Paracoccus chinensis]|uniref:Urease accessory protein n=1 Tax=Paracoccus chinensis TaxID=525640 RepID=A0A1G9JTC8_9RHOB|nr:HupE/UreJ family protein [Paracoccus chinensis]SDL40890.1 urease accessory protein [Paracoccus chinensis]